MIVNNFLIGTWGFVRLGYNDDGTIGIDSREMGCALTGQVAVDCADGKYTFTFDLLDDTPGNSHRMAEAGRNNQQYRHTRRRQSDRRGSVRRFYGVQHAGREDVRRHLRTSRRNICKEPQESGREMTIYKYSCPVKFSNNKQSCGTISGSLVPIGERMQLPAI